MLLDDDSVPATGTCNGPRHIRVVPLCLSKSNLASIRLAKSFLRYQVCVYCRMRLSSPVTHPLVAIGFNVETVEVRLGNITMTISECTEYDYSTKTSNFKCGILADSLVYGTSPPSPLVYPTKQLILPSQTILALLLP